MAQPKKYIKVDGVMKLNPEYKRWKDSQAGINGGQPATTVYNPTNHNNALPIVTNMDDHMEINQASVDAGDSEIKLSEATNATIEMMQEPEISLEAGMQPDEMVDALGAIMNKYEVPMGLMNKLMMLSEFESLEFIIDDSGSMTLLSDTYDVITRKPQTRWQEAHKRLKEMVEILAYVPFTQIDIVFLNRPDHVTIKRQQGQNPQQFLQMAYQQIDRVFARGPSGSTPALEKLQQSFLQGRGRSIARYFFGDGTPNGGDLAKQQITKIVTYRENPQGNPVTFLSCTNEDDQVEWMKDAEEIAPYCSESDDFKDEAEEVLRDQGSALPYSKGFHLICQLVAAMNPDDLDAMDESVPFTKRTLDNILGIEHNEQSYRHYFNCFIQAQRSRKIEGKSDTIKKNQNWESLYNEFLRAPVANQIPAVQQFKNQLKQLEGGAGGGPAGGGMSSGPSSYGGVGGYGGGMSSTTPSSYGTTTPSSYGGSGGYGGGGTSGGYGVTPSAPPTTYDNNPPVVQATAYQPSGGVGTTTTTSTPYNQGGYNQGGGGAPYSSYNQQSNYQQQQQYHQQQQHGKNKMSRFNPFK